MTRMLVLATLLGLGFGAHAQQQAVSPAAPDAQVAPGKWEVERVPCSAMIGAADDDRAAAAMFYYGYVAAKANIQVVDVSRITQNIEKVMKQCTAAPTMTVPQAFHVALAARD